MRLSITLLALFIHGLLSAQNPALKGRVIDEKGEGLPFVNISINGGRQGTSTDLDGYFLLPEGQNIQRLRFSYIGYETEERSAIDWSKGPLVVRLKDRPTSLDEVVVMPGENPAHRIIREAVRNKSKNDPEELERFQYRSYSRFWVTVNRDSVPDRIDTVYWRDEMESLPDSLRGSGIEDSIMYVDSSKYDMHRFLERQHIFFMETLTERKYLKPRDNESVIAQRTSGFKNPMFALIVTQFQSFSFYGDYIGIQGDEYLNPISKGSTRRYFFLLEDTLFTPEGDSLFSISFRPRPQQGFKALKGVITLHSRDWAIANVRAQPAESSGLSIEVRQAYRRYGQHSWFPVSFEADIQFPSVSINDAHPVALLRRELSDIQLEPSLRKKDIDRERLSVDRKASVEADTLLATYRGPGLDSLATNTYQFLDSIGEAEKLDEKLKLLMTLARGSIPLGPLEMDINRFLRYNRHEGWRLGLGLSSSDKLLPWGKLSGYYAYGFGDESHKYGGEARIDLNKNRGFHLLLGHQFDIFETGGFDIPGERPGRFLENHYRFLGIEQWDEAQVNFIALQYDPLPRLSLEGRLRHEQRLTRGNYQFSGRELLDLAGQRFNYSELGLRLRWAPRESYASTPMGKIRIGGGFPIFHLHYSRGLGDFLGGDFAYDRWQASAEYERQSRAWGRTRLNARAGWLPQNVPLQKLWVGSANTINDPDPVERYTSTVADRNSFETMRFNEFLSSQYLEIMWRQDFASLLFKRGNFAPHIEIVNRAAWGRLEHRAAHEGYQFKTLRGGFYESGLELNRLLKGSFSGFGLGFYYRYGPNQLPEPVDNLAIKLSSKFSF